MVRFFLCKIFHYLIEIYIFAEINDVQMIIFKEKNTHSSAFAVMSGTTRAAMAVVAFLTIVMMTAQAQTVYQKDRWGAKLFYMENNTIRMGDRWGEQLLWYDASTQQVLLKDRWGQPLIYIDGETVRLKDRWGEPLLYFDGLTIRQKDRWGIPLYYLDGQTLRQKDRWGAPLYYFDFIPNRWQIACLVLM